MKRLLVCLLLVGVVGCGEKEQDEVSAALNTLGFARGQEKDGRLFSLTFVCKKGNAEAAFEHINRITSLRELNLTASEITDADLVHVAGLTRIKVLHLWGVKITDAALVHLKGLTTLETLGLVGTQVTDAGVAELQKALSDCLIVY